MAINFDRRNFLKTSAGWALALSVLPHLRTGKAFAFAKAAPAPSASLDEAFQNPPHDAWPWVYWFVADGNLTREGITADFEALHRVGIRGVLHMETNQFVPTGPVRALTPQWRELMQHAIQEATRLGITFNLNNDGGWCGSGGPWITPELSMQMLVWSEVDVQGPKTLAQKLAQPKTVRNYYEDIAVLAFPTPAAEGVRMADCSPQFTYGLDRQPLDDAKLTDGNPGTVTILPLPEEGHPQYLNIDFPEPFTAQAVSIALDPWETLIEASLEVSDDGQTYRTLRPMIVHYPYCSINFEKVTSRHFRIVAQSLGDWFHEQSGHGIPLGEVELHACPRIEEIPGKALYIHGAEFPDEPVMTPEMVFHPARVLNLSSKTDAGGTLTWDVPEGKWTVLRLGHTSTGKMNHPAPQESLGLECDKLSKKAIEVHFAGLVEKVLDDQKASGAKALTMTHIDSWEVGSQNWTPGFREEFHKRYGYDLLPYLPVLTGRAAESRDVSERFLWDVRRLVADMLLENYAGHMRELAHQHGLTLSIEAYDGGPLDQVPYGGRADVPMSEFWTGQKTETWNKEMASAAHVYGRPVVAAEAFTAEPKDAKWQNHPYRLKPLGDLAYTQGINRFVFHRYAAQPWLNRAPGMTMGPWGIHYERTNTWWEQSKAWISYLARCQALLQQGQFVADVAYLGSENAPNAFPTREHLDPALPPGYDFDELPPEVLLKQASVRDGRVVLRSGMSYRILVLTPGRTMTPALLHKIKDLVEAGATIVAGFPSHSPSLAGYPQCDLEVQRLASEIWGDCDGISIAEHTYGKGKVICGKPLEQVLKEAHTPPDFACHQVTVGEEIRYIHRNVSGDDVYFVASAVPETRRFLCTFRVQGKRPEIWRPDTGRIETVRVYDEGLDNTRIPLTLDPSGSAFVIFHAKSNALPNRVISIRHDGVEISGLASTPAPETQLLHEACLVRSDDALPTAFQIEVAHAGTYELHCANGAVQKVVAPAPPPAIEIRGPWNLSFPKGWGAPEQVMLPELISWTDHANSGVKYFSGTATYRRRFEVSTLDLRNDCGLYLDLGCVEVMAEVMLNGHDLGIFWKPPFRAEVTRILRAGANDLEVRVVNLWPNRLIGDEQLPDDCQWSKQRWGEVLSKFPDWLLQNKPRPSERLTFTTWKHWRKDDPLLDSGLLGPVRIVARIRAAAQA